MKPKCFWTPAASLLFLLGASLGHSQIITFDATDPAFSTSTIGSNGRTITAAVNGSGLSNDANFLDKDHSPTVNAEYWLSGNGAVTAGNEELVFRFASASDVSAVHIWNYYNANTDWNTRGLKSFDLSFSSDPTSTAFGSVTFGTPIALPTDIAIGSLNGDGRVDVQTVAFPTQSNVTFVRLSNLVSHRAVVNPPSNTDFFALNEIRFGGPEAPPAMALGDPEVTVLDYDQAEATSFLSGEDASAVTLYWGTVDQGESQTGWDGSASLGAQTAGAAIPDPAALMASLTQGTTYHCRFYAESATSAATAWSNAASFTTPNALLLTNPQTTYLAYDEADVRATSNRDTDTTLLYWGTTDPGATPTGWDNGPVDLGAQIAGTFLAETLSGLTENTTYYFRYYGESSSPVASTAWSEAGSFTTPNALELTFPEATSVAFNEANVTVTSNFDTTTTQLYWGESDPGATAVGWDNGPVNLGPQSAGTFPDETLSGLTENTTYYFRYFCESSSPAASTAWSDAGTFKTPLENPPTIITPSAVTATNSQATYPIENTINSSGLDSSAPSALEWTHDPTPSNTNDKSWLGAKAGTEIIYELPGTSTLNYLFFWSYWGGTASRSLTAFDISFSSDGVTYSTPSTITLGTPGSAAEFFSLGTQANVTHVKFDNLQNGGDSLAGIGEVRFGGETSGPTDPYGTWAAGPWSGTLTDNSPTLDFDGGGLDTGIEWVVGGDPTDPGDDAGNAPTGSQDTTYLIFTYNRRDAAATDANTDIKVVYGSNLTGWTEAVHDTDGVVVTVTDGSPFDSVEVKIPKALAVDGRLFARLEVTVTP